MSQTIGCIGSWISSPGTAAWVQAVASVLAIVVAIYIQRRQYNQQKKMDLERQVLAGERVRVAFKQLLGDIESGARGFESGVRTNSLFRAELVAADLEYTTEAAMTILQTELLLPDEISAVLKAISSARDLAGKLSKAKISTSAHNAVGKGAKIAKEKAEAAIKSLDANMKQ